MTISWRKQLVFNFEEIKKTNPIPDLVQNVTSLLPTNSVTSEISTILTELYNNAVDHGLLNLSSDLKQGEDGLEKYYKLRQEQLKLLDKGFVKMDLDYVSTTQTLNIEISDSGPGFDCQKYLNQPLMLFDRAGRGLYIINKIASRLEYKPEGNLLKLEYRVREHEQLLPDQEEYNPAKFNS